MKTPTILAFLGFAAAATAAPVTREQLLSMARDKVDPQVMRAIVERDCVDFDVDATNAAELSRVVSAAVLEAAIACRRSAAAPQDAAKAPAAAAPPSGSAPQPREKTLASPSPSVGEDSPPAGARIRLRAVFIGESAALRCTASIDGAEAASLVKEEQGKFGEAVERTKIGRESASLPVPAGRHRVLFRCDPRDQTVAAEVDVPPGESRTVEIAETTLRHWKLRRISTP